MNKPTQATSFSFYGQGSPSAYLSQPEISDITADSLENANLSGKRVLVIIPDGTRTAPVPLFFRLLCDQLQPKTKSLDFLIALGTHQPMSEPVILEHVGITPEEKTSTYKDVHIINHRWDLPETFIQIGTISKDEAHSLSQGMLSIEVPVRINRLVLDYDVIIICGPVFPHEVVGFSGGRKYISPGISGAEIINFTHWLGALITSYEIIGTRDTPVRAVIERVGEMVPRPTLCFCYVVGREGLHGLYTGDPHPAWMAAAALSAQVHVKYAEKPYNQVLSVMPRMYDDLWTGAKGMYKLEPVIADGGEITLYAPHIREISYTHGAILDQIGYHVRDYFVKQWDQFKHFPWGVLAHSTHLRGIGTYENGIETPRIQVTLATGIPSDRCAQVNLGYRDPRTIQPEDWAGREDQGVLLVPHAGEMLYRLRK
jgi:nickel-dependent lactate racemase